MARESVASGTDQPRAFNSCASVFVNSSNVYVSVVDATDDADITAVQGHLEEFLGLPVKIKTEGAPGTGTVTIGYRTLDQLDLICQRLTGGDI